MIKNGIDQNALIAQLAEASIRQGEAIRDAVQQATLQALQGRELTLANIRPVLDSVAQAASAGAAKSMLSSVDVEGLLAQAFAGMDGALEQALQAHRSALQQLASQGASLREAQVSKALDDIGQLEETLFAAVRKAAAGAGGPMAAPWLQFLQATQAQGTATGAQAAAIGRLIDDTQRSMRDGRALGVQASQAMLDAYSTLVSGVLIGMTQALQRRPAVSDPAPPRARAT